MFTLKVGCQVLNWITGIAKSASAKQTTTADHYIKDCLWLDRDMSDLEVERQGKDFYSPQGFIQPLDSTKPLINRLRMAPIKNIA
jgi:hypothetical protein